MRFETPQAFTYDAVIMFRIVPTVTLFAERAQVRIGVIAFIVIEMRGLQGDAQPGFRMRCAVYLLAAGPGTLTASVTDPAFAAALTAPVCAFKAYSIADFRPVVGIVAGAKSFICRHRTGYGMLRFAANRDVALL